MFPAFTVPSARNPFDIQGLFPYRLCYHAPYQTFFEIDMQKTVHLYDAVTIASSFLFSLQNFSLCFNMQLFIDYYLS